MANKKIIFLLVIYFIIFLQLVSASTVCSSGGSDVPWSQNYDEGSSCPASTPNCGTYFTANQDEEQSGTRQSGNDTIKTYHCRPVCSRNGECLDSQGFTPSGFNPINGGMKDGTTVPTYYSGSMGCSGSDSCAFTVDGQSVSTTGATMLAENGKLVSFAGTMNSNYDYNGNIISGDLMFNNAEASSYLSEMGCTAEGCSVELAQAWNNNGEEMPALTTNLNGQISVLTVSGKAVVNGVNVGPTAGLMIDKTGNMYVSGSYGEINGISASNLQNGMFYDKNTNQLTLMGNGGADNHALLNSYSNVPDGMTIVGNNYELPGDQYYVNGGTLITQDGQLVSSSGDPVDLNEIWHGDFYDVTGMRAENVITGAVVALVAYTAATALTVVTGGAAAPAAYTYATAATIGGFAAGQTGGAQVDMEQSALVGGISGAGTAIIPAVSESVGSAVSTNPAVQETTTRLTSGALHVGVHETGGATNIPEAVLQE